MSLQPKQSREVGAPVNRHRHAWTKEAQGLRGAPGVEMSGAKRGPPTPDGEQCQLERRERLHLRKEVGVPREIDTGDGKADGGHPSPAAADLVNRLGGLHLQAPNRRLLVRRSEER